MYPSVRDRFGGFNKTFEEKVPDGYNKMVHDQLFSLDQILKKQPGFTHFERWPADAQLALLSMAWALGPKAVGNGVFNRFKALGKACANEDFDAAAATCAIGSKTDAGTGARNKANARLFINAACVAAEGSAGRYQRPTLYYPRLLGVQDSADLSQAHAGNGAMRLVQALNQQALVAAYQRHLEENRNDPSQELSPTGQQKWMLNNLTNMTNIPVEQLTGGKSGEGYESRRYNRLIFMALRKLRDGDQSPNKSVDDYPAPPLGFPFHDKRIYERIQKGGFRSYLEWLVNDCNLDDLQNNSTSDGIQHDSFQSTA